MSESRLSLSVTPDFAVDKTIYDAPGEHGVKGNVFQHDTHLVKEARRRAGRNPDDVGA